MFIKYNLTLFKKTNTDQGYMTIFLALTMPLIIAVLGICLDGSLMLFYDAKLSTAVKFAAISASSINEVIDGNLEITADINDVNDLLHINMEEAQLVDFFVNPANRNECTVKASFEVPFVFMKIFGFKSKILVESYTARRYS